MPSSLLSYHGYKDVEQYCSCCSTCQQAKLPLPQKAPFKSVPIGAPWKMIAVDILESKFYQQQPLFACNTRLLYIVG